jgi:DNA-binding transcriptional MerR regulator
MAKKPRTYRTAEVCKMLSLQPYVLKHWEEEFPGLASGKAAAGAQRSFTESELALIRRIRELLYDEGFTIAGARKKLETDLPVTPALFDHVPGDPVAVPTGSGQESPPPVSGSPERSRGGAVAAPSRGPRAVAPAAAGKAPAERTKTSDDPSSTMAGSAGGGGSVSAAAQALVAAPAVETPGKAAGEAAGAGLQTKSEAGSLDTGASERVETLRRGIAEALSEARTLLAALETATSPRG